MDADVIVVGAGAAGLAAARRLAERSLRVILVEARDRVGGRVWSQQFSGGTAELGAEFVHGPARETMALLREVGTRVVTPGDASWVSEPNAPLRRTDNDFSPAIRLFERAAALPRDESVSSFLERFAGEPSMEKTVVTARAFVEGFEAADPAVASVKAIADEVLSGTDSITRRPVGGYGAMLDLLWRKCTSARVRPHLSTVVHRIAWHNGDVTVESNRGNEERIFRARAAVVTLPVGVMRHEGGGNAVSFNPELPALKRKALHHIEMGSVVKIVLRFQTRFWETLRDGELRDATFFRAFESPFTGYWTEMPVRNELIVAWAGGPNAVALESLTLDARIELALREFGAVLGDTPATRAHFAGAMTHDWGRDPFARGAYSFVRVGGGDARARLGEPLEDTLFFAGEACSTDGEGGTVNGAMQTGERAAAEVAAALGAKEPRDA